MTAFVCSNCGLWIGTEYKGNASFYQHKCDPEAIEAVKVARTELKELDQGYAEKRRKIEDGVVHSY